MRIGLNVPYDPAKLERDSVRSLELQNQAVAAGHSGDRGSTAIAADLSLRRFAERNEQHHERRLTALRYHIPEAVIFLLIVVAMVATGFTGYHAGARSSRGRVATLIMSLTIAVVIMLVIDLDRPARGLRCGDYRAAPRLIARRLPLLLDIAGAEVWRVSARMVGSGVRRGPAQQSD